MRYYFQFYKFMLHISSWSSEKSILLNSKNSLLYRQCNSISGSAFSKPFSTFKTIRAKLPPPSLFNFIFFSLPIDPLPSYLISGKLDLLVQTFDSNYTTNDSGSITPFTHLFNSYICIHHYNFFLSMWGRLYCSLALRGV